MTKLEIQAIQCLPAQFVRDGTQVATCQNGHGHDFVVAINPLFGPIVYEGVSKEWKPMLMVVEKQSTAAEALVK